MNESSGRAIPERRGFSTRENSEFKWKHDKTVVGALEVPCQPQMNLRGDYEKKVVSTVEDSFAECLELWKSLDMKNSFVEACESIPPETSCCGLANNQDKSIKNMVPLLNTGWAVKMNEQLKDKGFKVSCFVWNWTNITGEAETVVLLVRFHQLKPTGKENKE